MTDMALAVARLTAVSRLGTQGRNTAASDSAYSQTCSILSRLLHSRHGSRRVSFKYATVDWSLPMSFLRNNDVKKHLARAVPRSVAVATADPVADPEIATTFQPEDEVFAGPITIEVPEKIRPM